MVFGGIIQGDKILPKRVKCFFKGGAGGDERCFCSNLTPPKSNIGLEHSRVVDVFHFPRDIFVQVPC